MRNVRVLVLASLCTSLIAQSVPQPPPKADHALRDYAIVAQHLVPPLFGEEPRRDEAIERAAIEAKERWRVVTLRSVESSDRRIAAVAREGAEAHSRLLDQVIEASDGNALVLIATLAVAPVAALVPLAREGDKAASRVARYEADVQRRRAANFLLPELAREFAGPPAEKAALAVDFDERWFGLPGPDRVNLVNGSGRDLTNCTVQVDLRGRDGKWVRNVHFVPAWPAGKKLWADYLSVDPREVAALAGTTAIEVQELAVSLWCAELRSEGIKAVYDDAARCPDQLRQLEASLELVVDYVHQPWIEKGPCIGLTMKAGGDLGRAKVEVTCAGTGEPQQLSHSVGEWPLGARISVQSFGALKECPASVDVAVTVDGMSTSVVRKNLKVSSRR